MENCFRLTTICKILDVDKKIVRKWVSNLKPLSARAKHERVALEFSSIDLLFLHLIRELNLVGGVSIEKMSDFSESLFIYLQKPSSNTSIAKAYLAFNDGKWDIFDTPVECTFSYCLPIGNSRESVLDALGIGSSPQQHNLNFGLVSAKN